MVLGLSLPSEKMISDCRTFTETEILKQGDFNWFSGTFVHKRVHSLRSF